MAAMSERRWPAGEAVGDAIPQLSQTMSFQPVESVRRALLLLRMLNEHGVAKVRDLATDTGLPKATIVRMLETMIAEGYVTRDECLGGYSVTSQVKALSSGYTVSHQVLAAARAHIHPLADRILWPVSVATVEKDQVVVKFSTSPQSCLSYPFNVLGEVMDLAHNALGRVWLAFASQELSDRLVARQIGDRCAAVRDELLASRGAIVAQVRQQGFAKSIPIKNLKTRHEFVAMPLRKRGRLVAAVGVGYYASAMQGKRLSETVIDPLRQTVDAIEAEWSAAG
ncbi:helix-turn-helix domain-containing protein [Pseudoroseicyclus sp. CXY001]|uniref:helix-turn-helix domain-containing protein n=1 Tax=Pseudoroseicyclus sp. CXY001 TaxID=3242492 RepID=UPI00358DAF46